MEQRIVTLDLFLNPLENGDLIGHSYFLPIVVNDHAEDVAELQNEDLLLQEDATNLEQDLLEKLVVVVEVTGEHEFRLESGPDRV